MTFLSAGAPGHNVLVGVREQRLRRGWSQEHLAELSGLSVRTIQRIENGQTPGLASTTALATALGIDVGVLRDDENSEAAPALAAVTSFHDAVRECLTNYAAFEGRSKRAEYWWFMLFVVLAGSLAALLHATVAGVVLLLLALPLLAAGTRRLRDAGHSGWWQLLTLVPFGGVVPLILLAQPSVPAVSE